MTSDPTRAGAEQLRSERILLVGTGAPAVSTLPERVLELERLAPECPVRITLTRQSLRFLTTTTLKAVSGRSAFVDEWSPEGVLAADHVEITSWATVVLVYPATLRFLSHLALGLCDTPVMLALQCSTVPILIAPSLPPGGFESTAYRDHLQRLAERSNVHVVAPQGGLSMRNGEPNIGTPRRFTDLVDLAARVVTPVSGGIGRPETGTAT